jgi:D-xylulose reductase
MESLVLEPSLSISLREIAIEEPLGPTDVRVAIRTVGICGSDVHYYVHGRIGPFVVREPMVLGHEASGVVVDVGSAVTSLAVGDRVCMEPGIPRTDSPASLRGMYNLDTEVRFWATPPVHGILRPTVVHPAAFTFRLPDKVSFAEGAMAEPLAVGLQAVNKARLRAGSIAVVLGAGPIGILTALAAVAGGCSRVILSDIYDEKLRIAEALGPIVPVNAATGDLRGVVAAETGGWGADAVFEASGARAAAEQAATLAAPGGVIVFVGMPSGPVSFDVVAAQARELRTESVFRYANVFPQALALMESRRIDVRPLITDRYPFERGIEAFDFARGMPRRSVKVQIELDAA